MRYGAKEMANKYFTHGYKKDRDIPNKNSQRRLV
jgi:hypothetical protein